MALCVPRSRDGGPPKRERETCSLLLCLSFPLSLLPGHFSARENINQSAGLRWKSRSFPTSEAERERAERREIPSPLAPTKRGKSQSMEFPFEGQSKGREAEKAPFLSSLFFYFVGGSFTPSFPPFLLRYAERDGDPKKEERRRTMISQKAMP